MFGVRSSTLEHTYGQRWKPSPDINLGKEFLYRSILEGPPFPGLVFRGTGMNDPEGIVPVQPDLGFAIRFPSEQEALPFLDVERGAVAVETADLGLDARHQEPGSQFIPFFLGSTDDGSVDEVVRMAVLHLTKTMIVNIRPGPEFVSMEY